MITDQASLVNPKVDVHLMKSAVIVGPKKIELKEVETPQPSADEVLIELEGCGLCASNIPVWEGRDWFTYPQDAGSPGHEGWGHIVAMGENVEGFNIGDRIGALSYHAFAQYDLVKAENVVKLPQELKEMPFPAEPLGCAWNIFERSDIKAGQTVAIIGIGFLGGLLTQLVKHAGAKVIALSRRHSSLDLAKTFGADEVISLDDHYKTIEKVKEITGGEFCDRVIEATGKEWPLNLAGELTKIRGRLIIAGFHQDGMRQVNVQLWNWRGLDVINAHERDPQKYIDGMKKAVEAVEQGIMDPRPLFTHTMDFENIGEAFRIHTESPEGYVKALIKF